MQKINLASGGPGARSRDIYKQFITNQSALRFMCRFKSFGTSTHSLLNFSPDIVLSVGEPESLARRSNWDVKALSIISGKPPGLYLEAESPDPSEWETAEPGFVLSRAEEHAWMKETRDRYFAESYERQHCRISTFPSHLTSHQSPCRPDSCQFCQALVADEKCCFWTDSAAFECSTYAARLPT